MKERLIDAELLKRHIDIPDCMIPQASMIRIIDREPTAKPERHGCWEDYEDAIYEGSNTYLCSECGFILQLEEGTPAENEYAYCPHCGARLIDDLEAANE